MIQTRIILGSDDSFTRAKEALRHLWDKRKDIELHEIEIKPYKKDRSTQANSYYWAAVIKPIAEYCGYTPMEAHNELLGMVYGWKTIKGIEGKERQVPNRRTTEPEKMNTAEFAQYIERCQQIAAELGVNIEPWSGP